MPERRTILITDHDRPDLAAPGNHLDVQAFGWDLAQRDRDVPLFTGEKTTANRDIAIMLSVRPGHPVIRRRSMWHRGHTAAIHGASARLEINSYTNADLLPDWDDPKRNAQYRKRAGLFYQSLIREHGPVRWMTLTTARIAYEGERAALGMDYAEAVLIIRRTLPFAAQAIGTTERSRRKTARQYAGVTGGRVSPVVGRGPVCVALGRFR
ncbi:hypothetical protein [Nonomuraea maheshkhaliensis]